MALSLFSSAFFDCYHFALALMNRWQTTFSFFYFIVSGWSMTTSYRVKSTINRLDPIESDILVVSQKARDIILIRCSYLDDIDVSSSTVINVVASWSGGNIILKLLDIRGLINGFDRVLVGNLCLLSRRVIFIPSYRMIRFLEQILFHLIVFFSWTWYQTGMLSLSMHRIFHRHDVSGSSNSCIFYWVNIFTQLETINNLLGFPKIFGPSVFIETIIFTK